MKFFKNKFFISVLCIALVLSIFSAVFTVMGVNNYVKTVVGDIFSPLEAGVWKIRRALEGYSMYFSDMNSLIEENNRLKDEIASLKEKLNDASLTEEEKAILTDACKIFSIKNKDVFMVEGEVFNIKITYPYDLKVAHTLLGTTD